MSCMSIKVGDAVLTKVLVKSLVRSRWSLLTWKTWSAHGRRRACSLRWQIHFDVGRGIRSSPSWPHGWIRSSMSWPHGWRTSCSPRSSASSPAQSSPPRPPRHKPQSPSLSLKVIPPCLPGSSPQFALICPICLICPPPLLFGSNLLFMVALLDL